MRTDGPEARSLHCQANDVAYAASQAGNLKSGQPILDATLEFSDRNERGSALARAHPLFDDLVDGLKLGNKPCEVLERDHVRPVRRRPVRILVRLDEKPRDSDCNRSPGENRHETAIPA